MKILSLLLLIFLLTTPVALATFTNEWGEYQDDYTRRGFVADERGYFSTGNTSMSIAQGSAFQPIMIDADNDESMEVIGSNGNSAVVWEVSSGNIIEQANLAFGAAQTVQHTALPPTFDGDDYTEWVTIHGTNVTVLEYNGTINMQCTNTTTASAVSGIACKNITGTVICYWGAANGNITEFNPLTCGIANNGVSAANVFTSSQTPIIEDIDNNGVEDLIIGCDNDTDTRVGLCDIELAGVTMKWNYEFVSADAANIIILGGMLVYPMQADMDAYEDCIQECKNMFPLRNIPVIGLLYKLPYNSCVNYCGALASDGHYGGVNKIVATFAASGGGNDFVQDGYMVILNTDGTLYASNMVFNDGGTSGIAYATSPVVLAYDDSTYTPICTFMGVSNTFSKTYCIDHSGTTVFASSNTYIVANDNTVTVGARMIEDDSYYQLIHSGYILKLTTSNTTTVYNFSTSGLAALGDVNDDRSLDLCLESAGSLKCFMSSTLNMPPTIFNNYSYGGYGFDYNTAYPLCVNTSINFQAQECGGSITQCNYVNDNEEDVERVVTNCGFNEYGNPTSGYTAFINNGTYHGSNPEFSCYYNNTGTFSVRLYLQDDVNSEDQTVYNTQPFVVQVINGEPGVTCNLAPTSVLPGVIPSTNVTTTTPDVLETVWDEFGITSSTSKNILGLAVIIGVMVSVGSIILSPFAIVAAGILALIIVTFMGLVSAYILILTLVGLALIYLVLGKVAPQPGG